MRPFSRGFTLIELLVVIAIIGLLSSIVLASLSTAREKAQDAQRESNVKSLKTALEMYYNDHGGYPADPTVPESVSALSTALAPYLSTIPNDPQAASGAGWDYASCTSSCHNYALRVYTQAHGWCRTSTTDMLGWWGMPPLQACPF